MLVDSVPLRSEGGLGWVKAPKRRLRKGWKAWSAELTGRYHNPSATGDPQDLARLPRWVCYLRAAAETRSTFIAQKQTHSPLPLLSWRPPSANTSGFSASCASGQQGGTLQTPEKHLLQGRPRGEVLCWPQ